MSNMTFQGYSNIIWGHISLEKFVINEIII